MIFRSIARVCLITVARSDTVSSLTERISKTKRRSVYRPRAVGVGPAREWSVCSRLAARRLRAAVLGFCALLDEPSKKSPMPGEMGALEGGGSIAELEGDGEGLKRGELYTRALSHRRRLSSSSSSSASSFPSFCPSCPLSLSYSSALPQQYSLSLFNQPPVVFHLARAPLEPTNHHRIPCSEPRA